MRRPFIKIRHVGKQGGLIDKYFLEVDDRKKERQLGERKYRIAKMKGWKR